MSGKELLYKSPNHVDNLNSMRLNNKWCDVIIAVDGMNIRAHKVILAANLKYFDVMLSNDAFQESKRNVITMESMKGADLETFVSYAYTGEILLTDSNALNLLVAADYLGENVITNVCIEFLKKHLKAKEACRAYKFANTIDCISLENVAKRKILSNFGICSQAAEYLDFNYEDFSDIFSNGKVLPVESQKMFLAGIMRWIMHDVRARKIRMEDLFNCVDITKLTSDDLGGYLYGNLIEHNDEIAIMRDRVMSYYHTVKCQKIKKQVVIADQTLTILDVKNDMLTFQLCNFAKKKWSPLEECPDFQSKIHPRGAILNNKLYFTSGNFGEDSHLNMFNPATKQITRLHSSISILRFSALCAHDKFLYFCGGLNNFSFASQRIRKFNTETNTFEIFSPMEASKAHAAAIFYKGCLHVLGGWTSSGGLNLVEKYDPDTKKWTAFPSMCEVRSSHAVAVLGDKLYACGGRQTQENSVEVYDPSKNSWQLIASMNKRRVGFLVVAHEGKLWAIGGDDDGTVEVYDPLKDEWQMDQKLSSGLQIRYPQGGLIPSSSIACAD